MNISKLSKFALIASVAILALSSKSFAEEASPKPEVNQGEKSGKSEARETVINQRQENQDKRIDEGVKHGELTKKEARKLEREQAHIEKMETKAEADGKITKGEMRRIEKAQNKASADIHRKKHNDRKSKK